MITSGSAQLPPAFYPINYTSANARAAPSALEPRPASVAACFPSPSGLASPVAVAVVPHYRQTPFLELCALPGDT